MKSDKKKRKTVSSQISLSQGSLLISGLEADSKSSIKSAIDLRKRKHVRQTIKKTSSKKTKKVKMENEIKPLNDSLPIHYVSSRDPESLSSSSVASPSSVIKMKFHRRLNVRKHSKDKIIKNQIQQSKYINSNATCPRSDQANIPMPNIQPDVSQLSELVINTNDAFEYKQQTNVKLSDMIKKYQITKSMRKLPLQQIKSEITNQISEFIYSKGKRINPIDYSSTNYMDEARRHLVKEIDISQDINNSDINRVNQSNNGIETVEKKIDLEASMK